MKELLEKILKEVFPFHIFIDEKFTVLKAGESFSRLSSERYEGELLSRFFISGDEDERCVNTLLVDSLFDRDLVSLQFKGTELFFQTRCYSYENGKFLLIFQVVAETLEGMGDAELSLDDLGIFNNTLDHLLIMNTKTERLGQIESLNKKLGESNEKVLKASELKNSFFANINHELRNPLNALINGLRLVQDDDVEEKNELIQLCYHNSQTIQRLINDSLDLSSIKQSKFEMNKETIHFKREMERFSQTTNLNNKKDVNFKLVYGADIPNFIATDKVRLNQILTNLVNNAIKFSPEKGEVKLLIKEMENKLYFFIQDEGIGIDKNRLTDIFEPFEQEEKSTYRNFGGYGLGLSIVKELVSKLGGEIFVNSVKGEGTTFYFYLKLDQIVCLDFNDEDQVSKKLGRASDDIKIAVVDDLDSNLFLLRTFLKKEYNHISTFSSGLDFMAAVEAQEEFDIVLLDLGMPGMDGFDVISALREFEKAKSQRAKAIALTGFTDEKTKNKCFDLGFDDFMTKPLDLSALDIKLKE